MASDVAFSCSITIDGSMREQLYEYERGNNEAGIDKYNWNDVLAVSAYLGARKFPIAALAQMAVVVWRGFDKPLLKSRLRSRGAEEMPRQRRA